MFSSIYHFMSVFVVAFLKILFSSDDSIKAFQNTAQSIWLLVIYWLSIECNVQSSKKRTMVCSTLLSSVVEGLFSLYTLHKEAVEKSSVNLSNFLEPFCFSVSTFWMLYKTMAKIKNLLSLKGDGFSFVHYAHILPQSESLINDSAKGSSLAAWVV